VAGIYIAILVYAACGLWSAFVYAIAWYERGHALSFEQLALICIVLVLWPLIWADDSIHKIKNRERDRIAKARGRV